MQTITRGEIQLWQFDRLAREAGLFHFVSGRQGGCSSAPYDSLNLGLSTADQAEDVRQNRQRLYDAVGAPPDRVASCRQVHGNGVIVVRDLPDQAPDADALTTSRIGVLLLLMMADCVPVVVYDPRRHAAGIAHAGWRGTVGRVAERLVGQMVDELRCDPARLLAGIGPSIGPCCYEVGADVIDKVQSALPNVDSLLEWQTAGHKARLNLWQANQQQLLRSGIPAEQVEIAAICTKCRSGDFFSDRAQRPSGRFGAGIMLL